MSKFKSLVAFVTSGTTGIGKAIVERIICQGGRVCIADTNKEGCNITKSMGDKAMFCLTDITQECDVLESLNQAKECFGKIDAVINTTEIAQYENVYDFKTDTPHCEDTFKSLWDVNVWGTFNVTRLAAGILSKNKPNEHKQRGVIINFASMMAFDATPNLIAYGVTKAAIAGMTIPLARGLASKGIRVVGVSPGYINTHLTSTFLNFTTKIKGNATCALDIDSDEEKKKRISMKLSPKRYGTPDEVSHLIQTIIENPIINGENIRIDCGWRYCQINDADETYPDKEC